MICIIHYKLCIRFVGTWFWSECIAFPMCHRRQWSLLTLLFSLLLLSICLFFSQKDFTLGLHVNLYWPKKMKNAKQNFLKGTPANSANSQQPEAWHFVHFYHFVQKAQNKEDITKCFWIILSGTPCRNDCTQIYQNKNNLQITKTLSNPFC